MTYLRWAGWPVGRSVGRSVGRWVARSVSQSVDRPIGRSVERCVDRLVGRSMGRSVGRWVGRSAFHPTRASTCSRKHNQNITFTDCTCGHSRGIRGHFGWAFGGHSRAFAGIRGHSAPVRVIRPQEEMTKSLQFINTSLARAPPEPPRQKPKDLVEQTLYFTAVVFRCCFFGMSSLHDSSCASASAS